MLQLENSRYDIVPLNYTKEKFKHIRSRQGQRLLLYKHKFTLQVVVLLSINISMTAFYHILGYVVGRRLSKWDHSCFVVITVNLIEKLLFLFRISISFLQGGRGHWAVYCASPQGFIECFLIRWRTNFGDFHLILIGYFIKFSVQRFNH